MTVGQDNGRGYCHHNKITLAELAVDNTFVMMSVSFSVVSTQCSEIGSCGNGHALRGREDDLVLLMGPRTTYRHKASLVTKPSRDIGLSLHGAQVFSVALVARLHSIVSASVGTVPRCFC